MPSMNAMPYQLTPEQVAKAQTDYANSPFAKLATPYNTTTAENLAGGYSGSSPSMAGFSNMMRSAINPTMYGQGGNQAQQPMQQQQQPAYQAPFDTNTGQPAFDALRPNGFNGIPAGGMQHPMLQQRQGGNQAQQPMQQQQQQRRQRPQEPDQRQRQDGNPWTSINQMPLSGMLGQWKPQNPFTGYPQQGYNFGLLGNTSAPRPTTEQLMSQFKGAQQNKRPAPAKTYDSSGFTKATGLAGLPDMKDLLSDTYSPEQRLNVLDAYKQYYGQDAANVYKDIGQGSLASQMGQGGMTVANTYAGLLAQNPGMAAGTNTPEYGSTNRYSWDLGNNQTAYLGASQPMSASGPAAWVTTTGQPYPGMESNPNATTQTTAGLSLEELVKMLGAQNRGVLA